MASYPADEQPAGVDGDQYFATLEAKYAQGICAYVSLPTGTFVVSPAEEGAGRFSGPCGVSGIGVYDTRKEQAPVVVDGQSQTLMTTRLYEVGTETPVNEYSTVRLSDGTLLGIIAAWVRNGRTYADYQADREVLLQVLTTYRTDP